MEDNTTTAVPSGQPTKNHSSYTQHHLHSGKHNHSHGHGHFPSKTILITITLLVTLVTVLFFIFVVLFLIRRQKSSTKNGNCKEESRELHDTSSRLITSTTLNSSPGRTSGTCYQLIANSFSISEADTIILYENLYESISSYEL